MQADVLKFGPTFLCFDMTEEAINMKTVILTSFKWQRITRAQHETQLDV